MKRKKPDFIIAGASKSGTSWVVHCLKEHPEVFVPLKEIDYFSENFEKGRDWYESHFKFADEDQVVLEKSPSYMTCDDSPVRVKEYDKKLSVIFIIRNPIKRAYSDYKMLLRKGRVSEDIENEIMGSKNILSNGMYYERIKKFADLIGKSKLEIFLFDDIKKDNEKFIAKFFECIGVDESYVPSLIGERVNESKGKPLSGFLEKVKDKTLLSLKGKHPYLDRILKYLVNSKISKIYNTFNRSSSNPPEMTNMLEEYLVDYYKGDIEKIGNYVGRDLKSKWLDGR